MASGVTSPAGRGGRPAHPGGARPGAVLRVIGSRRGNGPKSSTCDPPRAARPRRGARSPEYIDSAQPLASPRKGRRARSRPNGTARWRHADGIWPAMIRHRPRTRGVAAQHASLSRWRSPVRIRSGPPSLTASSHAPSARPDGAFLCRHGADPSDTLPRVTVRDPAYNPRPRSPRGGARPRPVPATRGLVSPASSVGAGPSRSAPSALGGGSAAPGPAPTAAARPVGSIACPPGPPAPPATRPEPRRRRPDRVSGPATRPRRPHVESDVAIVPVTNFRSPAAP